MSSSVQSSVDAVLEQAVASGGVPNVAAIAADRDGIIYEGGAGPRTAGESGSVGVDTRYRIMSMTKIVATTVALQLSEEGKLDFDAPVEGYCPDFGRLQVLERIEGDRPVLRPPASQATVKQLITHTSGLGYWFWNAQVAAWEQATGTPNVMSGSNVIFTAPLVADPGTRFVYGINTDWLGKVVEAAGGQPLDEAIRARVTDPLGMDETSFHPGADKVAEATPVQVRGEDGAWTPGGIELSQQPDWWAGGHGLYSTPRDYIKFQRMLLGNGAAPDGTRILQEATVDAAFTNQIGDLDFPAVIESADPAITFALEVGPGYKWGYGLLLNTQDVPGHRRAGSGAWAGLFNSHFWVDRTSGIAGSIYSNFLPFIPAEAMQMYGDFEQAVYASR